MKNDDPSGGVSRRFVLRWLSGATLALPVLPSLLTASQARAQAAAPQKNYVHLFVEHGSVAGANMFPADNPAAERVTLAGIEMRRSALTAQVSNGLAQLSPTLIAASSQLTPRLISKLNVLRGLDIPFGIAHYRGATLGNYAANNADNPLSAQVKSQYPRRTIDQVMAWSTSFYGTTPAVTQRSVTIAVPDPYADAHLSYGFANPAAGTGAITHIQGTLSSWELFARLFPGAGTTPTARAPIVDRVLAQYRALRDGNRRLSAADKQRLDDYLQRVSEVQRRLTASSAASCQQVSRPAADNSTVQSRSGYSTNPAYQAEYYRMLTDVIALALECGRTRIASLGLVSGVDSFSAEVAGPSWHDDVAHPAQDDANAQRRMVASRVAFFRDVLVPFVSKLDGIDTGDGKTLLDKSLVVCAQEHGNLTHQTTSIPVITAGGADGALRTGSYCDYRNIVRKPKLFGAGGEFANERYGVPMNQFFGNVLQVMGVPRAEYQESNHDGYGFRPTASMMLGDTNNTISSADAYPASLWAVAGQMLPWLAP
ncbi:MAG: DUF1552 domain-containing protein [Archangiaceae bacterium]|nr:DUF1552 domain-containing protein [Archangiaceae bacterium]